MGTIGAVKILLATVCVATFAGYGEGATTWLWYFTSTQSTMNWSQVRASFGTWPPFNFTTVNPWWIITTTTVPPTTSTIPTTTIEITTPPEGPEIVESTDTIFLAIIVASCVIGIIVSLILVYIICRISERKHKKTKRLRVKPLKADQAFAPVMHGGMGMMGMDPMGGMPGLMPPMDTSMMGMPGGMDAFGGMDPNAMGGGDPNVMMDNPMGMDPMGGANPMVMGGGEKGQEWFA